MFDVKTNGILEYYVIYFINLEVNNNFVWKKCADIELDNEQQHTSKFLVLARVCVSVCRCVVWTRNKCEHVKTDKKQQPDSLGCNKNHRYHDCQTTLCYQRR